MKKIISFSLTFILLLMCVVIPASANEVTSSTTGFTNIHFSNGYIGFCIDRQKSGSISGDTFTPADSTSVANNNVDNSDISQYLKVMFTQGFDTLFTPDGNGSYHITNDTADSLLAFAIYHFTGEQSYIWGEIKNLVNMAKAYEGPEIPDDGYSLTLDNGDTVTFSFMVLEPQKENQQSFFAYKINVSQEAPHEHNYGTDWESDDTNHWHECECKDKTDIGTHDGNTADCATSSVCGTCGKELAGVDKDNHTGETVTKNAKLATEFEDGYTGDIHCKGCGELLTKGEIIPATHKHSYGTDWESDDTNHWHECECKDKTDIGTHDGNTADCVTPSVCGTCGKELAGVDKDNHTGETVTKNAKSATEFEDGYTGDIHCKGCGELLTKGEIIPATHEHSYGTDWESDDTNHWHECECEDKADLGEHTYTDNVCTVCGKELSADDDSDGGDTDGEDDSDDGIFDMILGTLGDLNINIPDEIIEALSGLDTDAALDKITEYLSGLDMNVDFEAIINDLRALISGSDKPGSESKPETDTDTDDETADGTTDGDSNEAVGNTNSDIPDTGIGAGSKVALVIMLASVVAFALALISKKKKYVNQ